MMVLKVVAGTAAIRRHQPPSAAVSRHPPPSAAVSRRQSLRPPVEVSR